MGAIVLALALAVAYLQAANDNGTRHMELLHPQPKPAPIDPRDLPCAPVTPLTRFGVDVGALSKECP